MALEFTDIDFKRAAKTLNVEEAAIRAVAEIESAGGGFLPDGRPKVLYEAHIFHRHTDGKFSHAKDKNGKALSSDKWNSSLYGRTGTWQHDRLAEAAKLDWDAAHKAASWGTFQILGENHAVVGYSTIKGFVEAICSGAAAHMDMFVNFIKNNKLDDALRRKDWATFARGYNGPAYSKNKYDQKMAEAYRRFSQV
jgi:hypothetical protein